MAAACEALGRELALIPYVQTMFATGNDTGNRRVFGEEDTVKMNWLDLGLRGPKKATATAI